MGITIQAIQIIFVIAKIYGNIDWSWWLVFVPTYIYLVLTAIVTLAKK
jgi:hypothetical protein